MKKVNSFLANVGVIFAVPSQPFNKVVKLSEITENSRTLSYIRLGEGDICCGDGSCNLSCKS